MSDTVDKNRLALKDFLGATIRYQDYKEKFSPFPDDYKITLPKKCSCSPMEALNGKKVQPLPEPDTSNSTYLLKFGARR